MNKQKCWKQISWDNAVIIYGKDSKKATLKEFFSSRPIVRYIPVNKISGCLIAFKDEYDENTMLPKNLEVACVSKLFWKNCKKILKWAAKNS